MRVLRVFALLALLALIAGCGTTGKPMMNAALSDSNTPHPHKVLLMPASVRVSEVSAGGVVEKVDGWSNEARDNLVKSVNALISSRHLFQTVAAPQLPEPQKTSLDEHIALYDVVAGNAFLYSKSGGAAWSKRLKTFDYGIGPGLSFLAQQTGADTALFLVGEDYVSSSGRKAAAFVGALFGIGIPLGFNYLTAGVVDLQTGKVLWLNYHVDRAHLDMRNPEDMQQLVNAIFETYSTGGDVQ